MIDNEITQKTIELLDKIEEVMRASWVGGSKFSDRLEELEWAAYGLRKLIDTAEIDKAVKGIKQ